MTLTSEEIEKLTCALKHYHLSDYHHITDYYKVIDNRTELTVNNETVYKYKCPCQTIYLDSENYAITYDKQYVIEDMYYYDFNKEHSPDLPGTYTEIGTQEWLRNSAHGEDPEEE